MYIKFNFNKRPSKLCTGQDPDKIYRDQELNVKAYSSKYWDRVQTDPEVFTYVIKFMKATIPTFRVPKVRPIINDVLKIFGFCSLKD